jgi:hypothetical protein
MCTVTIVPHPRGVRLLCNRDERRIRPDAWPPMVHALGRRRAIFPVDPQGGGTWVGVNDAGLAVTLLNVHGTTARGERGPFRSRGLVVRELLLCRSLPDAAAAVVGIPARAFEPFRVVIAHDGQVLVATSAGSAPIHRSFLPLSAPRLFTSSSLGDEVVGPPRRRLFERMVIRSNTGWLRGQARFHNHRWSRRPEISVRMERDDALTVSRTTIDVTDGVPHLVYEAPVWSSLH